MNLILVVKERERHIYDRGIYATQTSQDKCTYYIQRHFVYQHAVQGYND